MASAAQQSLDPAIANAYVHLYRGELGRVVAYRVRLDTTTNWAVGGTALGITLAIGSRDIPHYVFFIPAMMTTLFLSLEATRYRLFTMAQQRVRLLEQGFYAPLLQAEPLPAWRERLAEALSKPSPPIGYAQALATRLRRVYLWLFVAIYMAWLEKLDLLGSLPDAAAIGPVPGTAVLAGVTLMFVLTLALVLVYRSPEEW